MTFRRKKTVVRCQEKDHTWEFTRKNGITRKRCTTCKLKVKLIGRGSTSFLDDHPIYNTPRVKGKHTK